MQLIIPALTGNLNGVTSGTTTGVGSVFLGTNRRELTSLCATVAVTAATSTITLTAKWQVSNDQSTWIDVANGSQNAAAVVLATGTAAIVTKAFAAPENIYGYRYARMSIVVGVTTGAAGDLYSVIYNYHKLSGAEAW